MWQKHVWEWSEQGKTTAKNPFEIRFVRRGDEPQRQGNQKGIGPGLGWSHLSNTGDSMPVARTGIKRGSGE